jgi:hypothetical protein
MAEDQVRIIMFVTLKNNSQKEDAYALHEDYFISSNGHSN